MMFWNRKKKDEQDAKTLTQDDTRKLIIDLRLPRIILELFDENLTDDIANSHFLSDEYKSPYSFFGNPMEHLKDNYRVDRYAPFLASYQSTFFAYDKVTKSFVSYGIEYFREENLERLTWDGLFIGKIISWWEDEWPEKDIIHVAGLLSLKHTKELLEEIALRDENRGGLPYPASIDNWFEWIKSLKMKYGGLTEG
jgi:hypothetical protein